MTELEKVEKLREKADVSFAEAKEALDMAGGDILDALIYLEKQGKSTVPAGGGFFSGGGMPAEPQQYANTGNKNAGHQGGDYYLVKDFMDAVENGTEPACNVYRAAEWTAVGLLSELSAVNSGRAMDVPHFRRNMPNGERRINLR